jgi:hypothetical protein
MVWKDGLETTSDSFGSITYVEKAKLVPEEWKIY